VRMPAPPKVTPLPPPLNGAIAAAIQPTYDRLFLEVHAGPVPASQVRSTLRSHVSLAIGIAGATLGTVADTTFLGYPAVRGTASSNGDPVKFLAFAVAGSEYALVVHSRHFAADQMKFFEDSVRIAPR
jgi:hypothetical protein